MSDDMYAGRGIKLDIPDTVEEKRRARINQLRVRRLIRLNVPVGEHVSLYNILGVDEPKEHLEGKPERKRWSG